MPAILEKPLRNSPGTGKGREVGPNPQTPRKRVVATDLGPRGKMGPQPTNLVGLVPILNIPRQESDPEVEANIPLTGKEINISGRNGDTKAGAAWMPSTKPCWTPVMHHVDINNYHRHGKKCKNHLIALINVVTV